MVHRYVAQESDDDVLRETLKVLLAYFGRMSADEAETFQLGYYAGAIASSVSASNDGFSPRELAARVDAEFRRIIDAERQGVIVSLAQLYRPLYLAEPVPKRKARKKR